MAGYETLQSYLNYDPQTGKFWWRERTPDMFRPKATSREALCARWNSKYAGKETFCTMRPDGYCSGAVAGKSYLAHRVAWAMVHGHWPKDQIDHINGNKSDNRIDNLRLATPSQNQSYKKVINRSESGFLGVSPSDGGWQARIQVDGKIMYLGTWPHKEDAALAYDCAAVVFNREFGQTNIIENPYLRRRHRKRS